MFSVELCSIFETTWRTRIQLETVVRTVQPQCVIKKIEDENRFCRLSTLTASDTASLYCTYTLYRKIVVRKAGLTLFGPWSHLNRQRPFLEIP